MHVGACVRVILEGMKGGGETEGTPHWYGQKTRSRYTPLVTKTCGACTVRWLHPTAMDNAPATTVAAGSSRTLVRASSW